MDTITNITEPVTETDDLNDQALDYAQEFFSSSDIRLQSIDFYDATWLAYDEENTEIGRIVRLDLSEWTMWEPHRKFDPEHPELGRTWKLMATIVEDHS